MTGKPYYDNPRDAETHRAVEELRAVLRRSDLQPDEDIQPRTLDDIATDVAEVGKLRRNAEYRRLTARLPALLDELFAAAYIANETERSQVHRYLTVVY